MPHALVERPDYRERIFIVGANGSGKSYFAARLLSILPRWVAIDLKGDFGEDIELDRHALVITSPGDWRWRLFPVHVKRIIYRPKPADYGTVDDIVGRMFERARILKKRHGKGHQYRFYLYCDEALLQSRGRKTVNLAGSAITGRSLEMGFIVSSQRLSWIPVEVRTEAWRVYVFYQSSVDEERDVLKLAKNKLTLQQLDELGADYSFYELKRTDGGIIQVTHFPKLSHKEVQG